MNWKTTFVGIFGGLLMFVGNAIGARQQNPAAPPVTFGNLAGPGVVALLGTLAADAKKNQG